MFRLVHVVEEEAEERVGQQPRARRVREVEVDDEHGERAKEHPKAERVEAAEGVERPDDAVAVRVEEGAVLLEHGLVCVLLRPLRAAVRGGCGGGAVRARGAWVAIGLSCGRERCGRVAYRRWADASARGELG